MAAYLPPKQGNDLVFNPENFDYATEGLSLQDADARYLKLSGGALQGSLNLFSLSASTRVEVESTDSTPITSTTNCDSYGLHLHSVLSSSNGRYPGSAIAFNNSSADNVPLSSISLDKISNGVGQLVFAVRNGSDCNERFRVTDSGINVQGTISVNGTPIVTNGISQSSADARYLQLTGGSMTGALTITIPSSNNSFSSISGTSACRLYHFNNAAAIFGTTTAHALQFQSNGFIRATLSSAGNFGVGTTNPNTLLDVNGTSNFTGEMRAVSIGIGNALPGSLSHDIVIMENASDPSIFMGRLTTANNGFRLRYRHNTDGSTINRIVLDNADGTEIFSITSNGRMGIGSPTPTQRFEVGGNINISVGSDYMIGGSSIDTLYVTKTGNNTMTGQLYINGSTSTSVPANRRYGVSGTDPSNQSGGSVQVSLRTSTNIWCAGDMYSSSDRRLKTNIQKWDSSKCMNLLKVDPHVYSWKRDESGNLCLGFIAQDLISNDCTDLVQCFQTNDEDIGHCDETNMDGFHRYTVEYQKVPLYLLEIIKRQQKQIKKQEALIQALIDTLPTSRKKQFDTLMLSHQIESLSDLELDESISP